jgi:beta-glucosidase
MTSIVDGLQGQPLDLTSNEHVLATLKHWVADGGTEGGVDRGDTVLSFEDLNNIHIFPYRNAVAQGAGSVMPSYSSYNGVKMHADPNNLISEVLKGDGTYTIGVDTAPGLGFKGFVISDWQAIDEIDGVYATDVRTSINGGVDMNMVGVCVCKCLLFVFKLNYYTNILHLFALS